MGAAVLAVVLLSTEVETATLTGTSSVVETATSGDSLDALLLEVGEDPLSSAELELLERLKTATVAEAASMAWPAPGPLLRPIFETGQRRRRETIARSTREAIDALALPMISFRGARSRVLYEGMLLAPLAEGVLDANVRMFDRVGVTTVGSRRDQASGAGGTIALYGPRPEVGIHPEASIEARSADRSAGSFGAVGGGNDVIRGRAAVGYDDAGVLRTPDGLEPRAYGQRWLASARIELLGARDDLFSFTLGGDLDRAHNTKIVDERVAVRGIARLDQRALAFARVGVGSKSWNVSLLGGYQGLRQEQELDEVAFFDRKADVFQVRLDAFVLALDWLALEAGGLVSFGNGSAPQTVFRRELEGYLFADLFYGLAEVGLRLAHQEYHDSSDTLGALRALPQVNLHVPIAGPAGFRAGFEMGMTVPGGGLFAAPSIFREPETTITVEAGPTLRAEKYWAELNAFASWIEHPLELIPDPTPDAMTPRSLRALGVELDGAFTIVHGFDVAFTASLSEAVDTDSGSAAYVVPVLAGLLALRYRFDFQNARIEVHARAATKPFELLGDTPMNGWVIAEEPPRAFVRAGITGGLDLGAGFALDLAVENAFDRKYRLHTTDIRGGGIDVRAALSWRW